VQISLVVLENVVGEAARSTHPVTLCIRVNITPSNLYNGPTSISTEDDVSPTEEAPIPGHIQSPSPEHPNPTKLAITSHKVVKRCRLLVPRLFDLLSIRPIKP
jgi:hypothetical protein